jgi:hypothetical protein
MKRNFIILIMIAVAASIFAGPPQMELAPRQSQSMLTYDSLALIWPTARNRIHWGT